MKNKNIQKYLKKEAARKKSIRLNTLIRDELLFWCKEDSSTIIDRDYYMLVLHEISELVCDINCLFHDLKN